MTWVTHQKHPKYYEFHVGQYMALFLRLLPWVLLLLCLILIIDQIQLSMRRIDIPAPKVEHMKPAHLFWSSEYAHLSNQNQLHLDELLNLKLVGKHTTESSTTTLHGTDKWYVNSPLVMRKRL